MTVGKIATLAVALLVILHVDLQLVQIVADLIVMAQLVRLHVLELVKLIVGRVAHQDA